MALATAERPVTSTHLDWGLNAFVREDVSFRDLRAFWNTRFLLTLNRVVARDFISSTSGKTNFSSSYFDVIDRLRFFTRNLYRLFRSLYVFRAAWERVFSRFFNFTAAEVRAAAADWLQIFIVQISDLIVPAKTVILYKYLLTSDIFGGFICFVNLRDDGFVTWLIGNARMLWRNSFSRCWEPFLFLRFFGIWEHSICSLFYWKFSFNRTYFPLRCCFLPRRLFYSFIWVMQAVTLFSRLEVCCVQLSWNQIFSNVWLDLQAVERNVNRVNFIQRQNWYDCWWVFTHKVFEYFSSTLIANIKYHWIR